MLDGSRKGALGLTGLSEPKVRALFPLIEGLDEFKKEIVGDLPFACLHLRRGDYLNVATHVVSDHASLKALRSVSRLVGAAVVISDSPLTQELEQGLTSLGLRVVTLVGGDPVAAHGLMRMSEVLICGNSQFSMTAAALRPLDFLTLCPSQHDGDLHSESNQMLSAIRTHQLMTGFDVPLIRDAARL